MRIIKVVLLILVVSISLNSFAVDTANVKMHVGSLKMLPIKDITRVAIGKGDIISTKIIEGKGLLLIAETQGDTELRVWRQGERESRILVEVTSLDPTKLLSHVKNLTRTISGISSRELNGMILLEGATSAENIEQLKKMESMMPNVINLVKTRKIDVEKMVRMEVKIIEFSKKQLRNLGIKWDSVIAGPAAGYAGASLTNDVFGVYSSSANGLSEQIGDFFDNTNLLDNGHFGFAGIITGITSQIKLLVDSGDAKLLAEPTLNTRSGNTAKFLAGGEFPVPVAQGNGAVAIEFHNYGIKLEIEPVADDEGNIQSMIKTEVSTLDFSVAVNGVPGLLSRKTDTVINVQDGETIVLSGLINSDISSAVSKVPWLSEIPILGELFKSKDFQTQKTELVVFVTPRIITPGSVLGASSVQRGTEMLESYQALDNLMVLD